MNTIVCPKCGKELTVSDPSRKFIFCRHCGTKIEIAAFVKKPPNQSSQEPIITPPPKASQSETSSQEPSAEQLRHQHELELERLRYEHELELERLRHENELERERLKYKRAEEDERAESADPAEPTEESEPAPKAKKRSTEKKSLSWKAGHFCKKHPIWTVIIVYCLFMGIFGGTSNSTSSSRTTTYSSSLPNISHYTTIYINSDSNNPTYYLFNFDDEKVCFVKTSSNIAWVADLDGSSSENNYEAVFYFAEGTITRKFNFSAVNSQNTLYATEIVASDTPSKNTFLYTSAPNIDAASILNSATKVNDCSNPV